MELKSTRRTRNHVAYIDNLFWHSKRIASLLFSKNPGFPSRTLLLVEVVLSLELLRRRYKFRSRQSVSRPVVTQSVQNANDSQQIWITALGIRRAAAVTVAAGERSH